MTDTDTQIAELQAQVSELREQNALLRLSAPEAFSRFQSKVARQRFALDTLNRKVTSQRLALRTIEELGRGLTTEEYKAARDSITNPQLQNRILESV